MRKPGSIGWKAGTAVVLVIVGAAALSLHGVFQRANAERDEQTCLENEKLLGQALLMYAAESDGRLPLYDNAAVPGYVNSPLGQAAKKAHPLLGGAQGNDRTRALLPLGPEPLVLLCPNDRDIGRVANSPTCGLNCLLSYTLNGLFLGEPIQKIVAPEQKILLIDECSVWDYVFLRYTAPNYVMDRLAEPWNFRHGQGLNCLYVDGHVKWLRETDWPETPEAKNFWWLKMWGGRKW